MSLISFNLVPGIVALAYSTAGGAERELVNMYRKESRELTGSQKSLPSLPLCGR